MYIEHFHLSDVPFENVPNPRYFFDSGQYGRILDVLGEYVRRRRGVCVLFGPPGSGKTTVGRALFRQIKGSVTPLWLAEPPVSVDELFEYLCHGLGMEAVPRSRVMTLEAIRSALEGLQESGSTCVLLVDEAHRMQADVLEEIRVLTNLESDSGKLLQIVLVGQEDLRRVLSDQASEPLRQRVAVFQMLAPLMAEQALEYVTFRLGEAGGGREVFDEDALVMVAASAGGLPRVLNSLSNGALEQAARAGHTQVQPQDVHEAAKGLGLAKRTGFLLAKVREGKRLRLDTSAGDAPNMHLADQDGDSPVVRGPREVSERPADAGRKEDDDGYMQFGDLGGEIFGDDFMPEEQRVHEDRGADRRIGDRRRMDEPVPDGEDRRDAERRVEERRRPDSGNAVEGDAPLGGGRTRRPGYVLPPTRSSTLVEQGLARMRRREAQAGAAERSSEEVSGNPTPAASTTNHGSGTTADSPFRDVPGQLPTVELKEQLSGVQEEQPSGVHKPEEKGAGGVGALAGSLNDAFKRAYGAKEVDQPQENPSDEAQHDPAPDFTFETSQSEGSATTSASLPNVQGPHSVLELKPDWQVDPPLQGTPRTGATTSSDDEYGATVVRGPAAEPPPQSASAQYMADALGAASVTDTTPVGSLYDLLDNEERSRPPLRDAGQTGVPPRNDLHARYAKGLPTLPKRTTANDSAFTRWMALAMLALGGVLALTIWLGKVPF